MQYYTTRAFPTASRQYEAGDAIDPTNITAAEWIKGTESGAVVPARWYGTAAELAARGIPGPGVPVYETDTKIARVGDGTTAVASLPQVGSLTYAGKVADDLGGAVLAPVRVPTLTVHRSWPNERSHHRIIWVGGTGGLTMYSIGQDHALRKSTDGGLNWSSKVKPGATAAYGYRDCFLILANNDALALKYVNSGDTTVAWSSDDGVTWTDAQTFSSKALPLGSQSWCQDAATGYIFFGEYYNTADDAAASPKVWRSTDNGRTWTVFYTFHGSGSGQSDRIRHIHGVQYDPVSQRVFVTTGDDEAKAGIYRINNAGDSLEPVVTNDQVTSVTQGARGIGMMFFADYIGWGMDTSGTPSIMRMARTQIGQASPAVEVIYRAGGALWFTQKAKADGSVWVISSGTEGNLDQASHLYAVSNNGARVWEVAAIGWKQQDLRSLQPLGPGGDMFGLGSFRFSTDFTALCSIDRGFPGNPFSQVARPPALFRQQQTRTTGNLTMSSNQIVTFGHCVVPNWMTTLYILDYGIYKISGASTNLRIRVVKASDTSVIASIDTATAGKVAGDSVEGTDYLTSAAVTAGETVLFQAVNGDLSNSAIVNGYVNFAWGRGASNTFGWQTGGLQ